MQWNALERLNKSTRFLFVCIVFFFTSFFDKWFCLLLYTWVWILVSFNSHFFTLDANPTSLCLIALLYGWMKNTPISERIFTLHSYCSEFCNCFKCLFKCNACSQWSPENFRRLLYRIESIHFTYKLQLNGIMGKSSDTYVCLLLLFY